MDLRSVLAHQGGWDETLFVAAPLVVFAVLLVIAKHRAEKRGGPEPGASGARDAPAQVDPQDGA